MQSQEQDISLLIEGCLTNNRKAQEQLYRQFYGFAMSIAMRYSRSEADAADIMSHAFVKIFKSMHTYDPQKGSLHAWIKRIVANEGLDHVKSLGKFSPVELEETYAPSIDNSVIARLEAEDIMTLIKKLPPATHAVFILYVMEGHTHKEIAAKLNISEGTSKWHLSEARKILKQTLQLQTE
ncbi:RNA polymerase sigma factor [Chitinophaga rhizophila]|uniref:RNA polymerase sigma factor n=1 Tax=Chitinophaga rhizophila TaxID=2866212 RepID=A0ABS7GBA4_9BACT|nr:RNA polymerase sigma factor [Chitinophaga rhizophila]MBW8684964.1 RNA polymerase sigma factor [Chitinophaga rhizophila]